MLALQEVETQIANSLDTALHKITSARDSAQNYQTVLNFNQNLLDSALARFEVGRLESRKVFDIEADLFDARNSQLEALVNYQRGLLELDLLEGSILQRRHLDLSQKQLQAKTTELISRGKLKEDQYQQFVKEMQWEYQKLKPVPQQDAAGLEQAREKLRQRLEQMSPHTNRPPDRVGANADDEVLRALHKRMEEDKP